MKPRVLFLIMVLFGSLPRAWSWHSQGHVLATESCLKYLEGVIPDFMVKQCEVIAHCSVDPDAFKFHADASLLYKTEYPEHFIDIEYLKGAPLPESREAFLNWCHDRDLSFTRVGTLPYAIAVNPVNGTVYLIAYDSGAPVSIDTANDAEGDYDLYRVDTQELPADFVWVDDLSITAPGHATIILPERSGE